MKNPIRELNSLGQSLWYDNIQRKLIENGELASMISKGEIRGITSNPTIFHNSIAKSTDYDLALVPLAWAGKNAEEIFWELAIQDIQEAADLLFPVYQDSNRVDGYVSLEVSPRYANDTERTIAQAMSLWSRVARPNLMIKIPATPEGIPAVRKVISKGINVNVTLIFSLRRYDEVMAAYLDGLEDRVNYGQPIDHIASVASFFVSRVDTKVDAHLQKWIASQTDSAVMAASLLGKASIANAKLAYAAFDKMFTSDRFSRLRANHNAQLQRPLWASTSTKNPSFPDTIYVNNLIGPNTVNTVPPQTLEAFLDHGLAEVTITRNMPQAQQTFSDLEKLGISIGEVTTELEIEGVKSFSDAYTSLLDTIESRRLTSVAQLADHKNAIARRIARLSLANASRRLHEPDPAFWTAEPDGQNEIQVRLGWLKAIEKSRTVLNETHEFRNEIYKAGFKRVLLLGMGGSSLAPEVMAKIFSGRIQGGLKFAILDSTDPVQVSETAEEFSPDKTLYIISSKSGGTAEVNALFNYFWSLSNGVGAQFIAITDPGTALEAQATQLGFRRIFLGDSTVGGRFSALTMFGLVPAALMGIDVDQLLKQAERMVRQCASHVPEAMNPGIALGAAMGQLTLEGRDKLTLIADPSVSSFGAWLEQLIAESSGKNGKGIVVVDGESISEVATYGSDRFFVYLRSTGDFDPITNEFRNHNHPVVIVPMEDPYDLGAEFYRWEVATSIACAILEVNAFDQPDVQLSKDITKSKINQYAQTGRLDEGTPVWSGEAMKIFSPVEINGVDIKEILKDFLSKAGPHDFLGINAYLPRNDAVSERLNRFRQVAGRVSGRVTTLGYGPRFLHSTGQLHKGGENIGLFIQVTCEPGVELAIPSQNMTFGLLEKAQALGDYEALVSRGRRILRIHLSSINDLDLITAALA